MSWLLSNSGRGLASADGPGGPLTIQRQPKPPKFDQCAATGVPNIDLKIENGRQRAIDFVQVAIRALGAAPTAAASDKSYRTALKIHFADPDAAGRSAIRERYQRLLTILKSAATIRCASSADEKERCQKKTELFGFVIKGTDTIIICPNVADETINCRAIGLIHEASHILGIGASGTHPPYRGTAAYPWKADSAPAGETPATRMDNPEAFAYFAAQIWRELDTSCPPPLVLNEVIEVQESAPAAPSKP